MRGETKRWRPPTVGAGDSGRSPATGDPKDLLARAVQGTRSEMDERIAGTRARPGGAGHVGEDTRRFRRSSTDSSQAPSPSSLPQLAQLGLVAQGPDRSQPTPAFTGACWGRGERVLGDPSVDLRRVGVLVPCMAQAAGNDPRTRRARSRRCPGRGSRPRPFFEPRRRRASTCEKSVSSSRSYAQSLAVSLSNAR